MSSYGGPYVPIGVTCILLVLCILAVMGRLIARRIKRTALGADDYLAIVALVGLAPSMF